MGWRAIPDSNGRGCYFYRLSQVTISVFGLDLLLNETSASKSRSHISEDSKRDSMHAMFQKMSVSRISKEVLREFLELDCKMAKAGIDIVFEAFPFTESMIGVNELLD